MKVSKKANSLEASLTRKLFNMAQAYDDVIDFTLGDPDVQTDTGIKEAACDAIQSGKTRYSANAGLMELRKAICDCFYKEYGLKANPNTDVVVTVGGMESLYLAFLTLLDPKDEVIIISPHYVNYVQMIKMCEGVPVVINTFEDNDFQPTTEQILEKITDRTVAMVLNSPANPSGMELGSKLLDDIADIANKYNLVIFSDEVYKTILFDGKKHDSIITRDGMQDRTVLIDSISKRFAMTGYRLGYSIGPEDFIKNMIKMQENICACAPLPSQYAAIAAYKFHLDDTRICDVYEERRNYMVAAINNIPKLSCHKPDGTFYLFVNISETGLDCMEFANKLLEMEHVAVVPGITYGNIYKYYIRIAFTLDMDNLKKAIIRIENFIKNI